MHALRKYAVQGAAAVLLAAVGLSIAWPSPALAQRRTLYGIELNQPVFSGQYLAIDNKTGIESAGAYTIEAWVRPASYANFPTIVGNNYVLSFWVGLNLNGQVRFYPRGGAGQFAEGLNVVPIGRWTHVAVTYDPNTGWAIYVNGVLDKSGSSILGAPGSSPDSMFIGADREAGTPAYFWYGKLDAIRIWSRALPGTQIRENMYTGPMLSNHMGPRYAGLEGCWYSRSSVFGGVDVADLAYPYGVVDLAALAQWNTAQINGNDGTIIELGVTPLPEDHNVALELNGLDDHATVDDHDSGYAGGVTVEAWICPYAFATFPTIAGRYFVDSFWFGLNSSGTLRFYPRGSSPFDGIGTIPLNRWTHVAATYDPVGGVTRLYINGVLDRESFSFSGPVGENGRDIGVGADNGPGGPNFFFAGMLDEVAITDGPLSEAAIRQRRLFGMDPATQPTDGNLITDVNGIERFTHRVGFGPYRYGVSPLPPPRPPAIQIHGSHARLVLSGAPLFQGYDVFSTLTSFVTDEFVLGPAGGEGLTPPDQLMLTTLSVPVTVVAAGVLDDVEVFVSMTSEALAMTECRLRSPMGTEIELFQAGDLEGRSLQTVFDDESFWSMADHNAPCESDARPAKLLSTFDGEPSAGTWTLSFQTSGGVKMAVWAVGVRLDLATSAVGDPGSADGIALVNAGPEPLQDRGAVRFAMPREAAIQLALYDASGRRARVLRDGTWPAGSHHVDWSPAGMPPGRYMLALDVEGVRRVLPVTVLR